MNMHRRILVTCYVFGVLLASGCKKPAAVPAASLDVAKQGPSYFHIDPSLAGAIKGTVKFAGSRPAAKVIDMSEDPACVLAHRSKAHDESILVGANHGLANAFVYIEKGLEGKHFEVPQTPVVIDQRGCWFHPRVFGIQTNQTLQVVNSDPVTHNIHPVAMVNREWNHSQGPEDMPVKRRFVKPEIMIPVKCNIHSWMHAYVGVLDHPYFAVTNAEGSFDLPNLPSGTYTLAVWHERLGKQSQTVTVTSTSTLAVPLVFHAK
jgi:hypothetical protein